MKIGLEIHVALPTKTKLFCSDSTEEAHEPNVNVCPTCMGFPGSRPTLNKEAVRVAKSVSIALNCDITNRISFIRKVYFYPDLPKSFQITQLSECIGKGGFIELEKKKIHLRRVQIEEDPARIIRSEGHTLIDFNRSGIPLIEVVTEPDITTEEELRETIFTLRTILYYQGIDINQEIKADLNISLGTERVEVKNVTGIKNLISAAEYEISRQSAILLNNGKIEVETRSFDEKSNTTKSSRKKESDEEYGFIFEPDLGFYSTEYMEMTPMEMPTRAAFELARSHNSSYKTILELIAFDKDALSILYKYEKKYDFKSLIATLEIAKRFNETKDANVFEELLKLVINGIAINQETVNKIKKGEKIEIKKFSKDEIDAAILEMLKAEKDIVKRYSKNKNVINFIVGTVSRKYGIQPRDVIKRVEILIDTLQKVEV